MCKAQPALQNTVTTIDDMKTPTCKPIPETPVLELKRVITSAQNLDKREELDKLKLLKKSRIKSKTTPSANKKRGVVKGAISFLESANQADDTSDEQTDKSTRKKRGVVVKGMSISVINTVYMYCDCEPLPF